MKKFFLRWQSSESLPKLFFCKGEVYLFGGRDLNNNWMMFVEKYSPSTKVWNEIADKYDEFNLYCACSFKDKIFSISGLNGTKFLSSIG